MVHSMPCSSQAWKYLRNQFKYFLGTLLPNSHIRGKSSPTLCLASLNWLRFFCKPLSPSAGPWAQVILAPAKPNDCEGGGGVPGEGWWCTEEERWWYEPSPWQYQVWMWYSRLVAVAIEKREGILVSSGTFLLKTQGTFHHTPNTIFGCFFNPRNQDSSLIGTPR